MRERKLPQPFTSRQSGPQLLLALLWLPVHLLLLPRLLWQFFPQWDESTLNVAVYAVGAVYMLLTQFSFLRRDFDPLCEHPLRVLLEVLVCYGAMLLFNLAVNGILMLILGRGENPNNAAVVDMAVQTGGPITALAIFLGGEMRSGIETVLDLVHFKKRLSGVDLVITGEGCADRQSCYGKVMQGVGRQAKAMNIPVIGLCGSLGEGHEELLKFGITTLLTTTITWVPWEEIMSRAEEFYFEGAVRRFEMIRADAGFPV